MQGEKGIIFQNKKSSVPFIWDGEGRFSLEKLVDVGKFVYICGLIAQNRKHDNIILIWKK